LTRRAAAELSLLNPVGYFPTTDNCRPTFEECAMVKKGKPSVKSITLELVHVIRNHVNELIKTHSTESLPASELTLFLRRLLIACDITEQKIKSRKTHQKRHKTLLYIPEGVCYNCLNGFHMQCSTHPCKCEDNDHDDSAWWGYEKPK
jgi:hypothetical protein